MRSSVVMGGEAVHNKGMQLAINRVRASSHVQGRSATVGVMMRAAKGTARCVWACGCSQLMPRPLCSAEQGTRCEAGGRLREALWRALVTASCMAAGVSVRPRSAMVSGGGAEAGGAAELAQCGRR